MTRLRYIFWALLYPLGALMAWLEGYPVGFREWVKAPWRDDIEVEKSPTRNDRITPEYAQARLDGLKQFDDVIIQGLRDEVKHLRGTERVILALRRKLIAADPSLPDEYDGTSWTAIEQEFLR